MHARLALTSLLLLGVTTTAQEGVTPKPAPPAEAPKPAQQDPDNPTQKPADVISELTREKERLEKEIEYARNRAKDATRLLSQKLGNRTQAFRGIQAGTSVVAPTAVQPMRKARILVAEELANLPKDVLLTVNGTPILQGHFDELMNYLRSSPSSGDDALRAQRALFDLVRTFSVASAFPENAAEAQMSDVVGQLEKGAKLADLVKTIGTVQGAKEDGRVEITRNSFLGTKAEQVAFGLQAGQRSRPFLNPQGYVLLEVEKVEKGASPELDKVIAWALQVSYQAEPGALQKAQTAAASGQVDIAVRDQQVMDMLPQLFKPMPAQPVGVVAEDNELLSMQQTLKQLGEELAKLEGATDEASVVRRKSLAEQKAQVEKAIEELRQRKNDGDADKAVELKVDAAPVTPPVKKK